MSEKQSATNTSVEPTTNVPKKRGRKSKKELMASLNNANINDANSLQLHINELDDSINKTSISTILYSLSSSIPV